MRFLRRVDRIVTSIFTLVEIVSAFIFIRFLGLRQNFVFVLRENFVFSFFFLFYLKVFLLL